MATQVSLNSGAVASAGALALQTNGTTQAVSISTSQVATLAQNPVLTSGTENGVAYLNGSKALTTGSALTFDGSNFQTTGIVAGNSAQFTGANAPSTGAGIELLYTGTVAKVQAYNRTGSAYLPLTIEGSYIPFNISGAEAMRLTSTSLYTASGINVGIGTSSPYSAYAKLSVADGIVTATNSTDGGVYIGATTGGTEISYLSMGRSYNLAASGDTVLSTSAAKPLIFGTNNVERARITSGGYFKASNSGTYLNATGTYFEFYSDQNAAGQYMMQVLNHAATTSNQYGINLFLSGDPNGTSNEFLQCLGNATTRAAIRSNGGIANYSANNVNLSDRREKTNFAPAGSYLDKICAIPVQTFNYIDQNLEDDGGLTLGVVAQDVQAVAPELVMESDWGTEENPKMRLSIYQTDLQYALMKCIQEQQAIIQSLTARITALEGA